MSLKNKSGTDPTKRQSVTGAKDGDIPMGESSTDNQVPPGSGLPSQKPQGKQEDEKMEDDKAGQTRKGREWSKLKGIPRTVDQEQLKKWLKDNTDYKDPEDLDTQDVYQWLRDQKISGKNLCAEVETGKESFIKWAGLGKLVLDPATELFNALAPYALRGFTVVDQIKGVDYPFEDIDVFLTRESTLNGCTAKDPLKLQRAELVEKLLKEVNDACDNKTGSHSRILLKCPPGCGKTSLLQQFVSEATRSGIQVKLVYGAGHANKFGEKYKSLLKTLPTPTVLVIDDVQWIYDDSIMQSLAKNLKNVVVVGAATYDYTPNPITPAAFNRYYTLEDLCVSHSDIVRWTKAAHSHFSTDRMFSSMSFETFERLVQCASAFASVTVVDPHEDDDIGDDDIGDEQEDEDEDGEDGDDSQSCDDEMTDEEEKRKSEKVEKTEDDKEEKISDGDKFHLGVLRGLVEQWMIHYRNRTQPVSVKDVEETAFHTDFKASPIVWRCFPVFDHRKPCGPITADVIRAVRTFYVEGASAVTKRFPKGIVCSFAPEPKDSLESSALKALVKCGALTQHSNDSYAFATLLSERLFFHEAFPARKATPGIIGRVERAKARAHWQQGGEGMSLSDTATFSKSGFLIDCISCMEPRILQTACASEKRKRLPIEHALQEVLFASLAVMTPVDWMLCPEMRPNSQKGRIDFQVDDCGVELMVHSRGVHSHQRKASACGRYASKELKEFIVVNFQLRRPPRLSTVKKALKDSRKSAHMSVVFEQDFSKAKIYQATRSTRSEWDTVSEVRLGREPSEVIKDNWHRV